MHLKTFDIRLTEIGYKVERLDLGRLWSTGDATHYTVSEFIEQINEGVRFYVQQKPDEIILVGHSRGAFTAIIAGSMIKEIDRIVALCPPPDIKASVKKWVNHVSRTSKRDLPDNPTEYREFSIPYKYVEDSLNYSAVDEVKTLHKPIMILIAQDDTVVPPKLTEQIVDATNNPHVARQPSMGYDFRNSQANVI